MTGWTVGVARARALDAQGNASNAHFFQVLHQLTRHAFGQVDQAVVIANVNPTDVAAFQIGLIGDRADDVARLHAVHVADFDAEGFHADFGLRGIAGRTR